MLIRLARPEDHDQWLPLWRGYQSFYKVDLPPEQTALNWQRFHDPAEPMHCAVAEVDGRLVGMVHYIDHRSCWTAGDYCYLQDLFAAPDCRGQGVGRALIEHVYAAAEAAGASRVWWLTHESNSDAMLLYDRIAAKSGFLQYRKLLGQAAPPP
jgi:GNAT superfamily N-acetyltransferase